MIDRTSLGHWIRRFLLEYCRISRLETRRFPEFGTTLHGTPAEP